MAKRGSLYISTGNVELRFDDALTVVNETHTFANEVVSQTLEDGSLLTDHIIVLQDELESQVFVSNSVRGESEDVYSTLKQIRNNRKLCSVYTDHELYSNMAIESVTAPHEAPMTKCITFTIKFKRVDWTDKVNNRYRNYYPPRKFEDPLVPQLQSIFNDIPNDIYTDRQNHKIARAKQNAKFGSFGNIDDIETSAVSRNDLGALVPLDNSRFPATSSIYDIIKKISTRNDFTEEEIESFFAVNVRDVIVEGLFTVDENRLSDIYQLIASNINYISYLDFMPCSFNIIVEGQVIQFELVYNNLLTVWKCGIKDALGQSIIENMTMMAGVNNIQDLLLKYHKLGNESSIITEDLVIVGLYATEPMSEDKPVYQRGIESSQYAFTENAEGVPPCYLCYFTNKEASEVYKNYINGEKLEEDNTLELLGDYAVG